MTVRTKQLGLSVFTTTGPHVVYTVPAGYRTIVKDVRFLATATTPGLTAVYVQEAGSGETAYIMYITSTTRLVVQSFTQGFVVMNEGDSLRVILGSVTGGGATFMASGTELQL